MMLMRDLVKVVKDTTLTESLDALSSVLGKLECGAVLELLHEPVLHGDLLRGKCRMMGENRQGWVGHLASALKAT